MIKKLLACAVLCSLFLPVVPAKAELSYFRDPVYKTLAPEDHHPMQDMIDLAAGGDAQAQFILADLYAKGKGGLEKSPRLARGWFEKSAFNGYGAGFIRLAALAKKEKDLKSALVWYTLAAEHTGGEHRRWARQQIKNIESGKELSAQEMSEAKKTARGWRKDMRRRIEQEPKPLKKADADPLFVGPPPPG
jgi:TPR repeat protein